MLPAVLVLLKVIVTGSQPPAGKVPTEAIGFCNTSIVFVTVALQPFSLTVNVTGYIPGTLKVTFVTDNVLAEEGIALLPKFQLKVPFP